MSNNFYVLQYEYEDCQAKRYREIFVKSVKKNLDDGLFSFIIVDGINDKTDHYQEMWSHAKQKGFEVLFYFRLLYERRCLFNWIFFLKGLHSPS